MDQLETDMFNDPKWMTEVLRMGKTGLWKIVLDPKNPSDSKMFANETMLDLLGLEKHPSPIQCYQHWFNRVDPNSIKDVEKAVSKMISGTQGEVQYPWEHPKWGTIFVRCGGKSYTDENGVFHIMGYHQDVSELHDAKISLQKSLSQLEKASIDELTGLLTRQVFFERGKPVLEQSRKSNDNVSFLMVDIDHFKKVNDTYGHHTGDIVLQEVTRRIRAALRSKDLAGRYGGEEFAFLLSKTSKEGAVQIAERIRKECEAKPFQVENLSLPVTVSVGVFSVPKEFYNLYQDKDVLMDRALDIADKALYSSKQNGRNCTHSCSIDINSNTPTFTRESP